MPKTSYEEPIWLYQNNFYKFRKNTSFIGTTPVDVKPATKIFLLSWFKYNCSAPLKKKILNNGIQYNREAINYGTN